MDNFQFDFVAAPEPDRDRGLRALGLAGSSLLEIMLHKVLLDAWAEENLAFGGRLGDPFDEAAEEAAAEAGQVLARAAVLPEVPGLPEGWENLAPAALAGVLERIDPEALDDVGTIDYLQASAKTVAWLQSGRVKALNRFTELRPAEGAETGNAHGFSSCAATEIAAALAQPRGAAQKDLAEAAQLCGHLPATVEAMAAGTLDLPRVTAIARGSADLPENLLPAFEAGVLPKAGEITVESVRARARKARERLHPESLTVRHEKANQSRNVGLVPQDDGMAEVWFRCSADKAVMVFNLVQALAKKLQGPEETRTLPQLRADVITDLLVNNPGACNGTGNTTGTCTGAGTCNSSTATSTCNGSCKGTGTGTGAGAGVTASVAVTLSLETAARLSEEPGELAGYGPIPPEMARNLAGLAKSWLLVLTDEYRNAIAAAKDLRHPSEWLKRLVRLRDGHCSGPGCRVEAKFCEVDHTIAWEDGGKTVLENLKAACKPDHRAKHKGGWKVTQHPDGSTTWKSRTGHEWTSTPENSWSIRPPTEPPPPDLYTPPPF
ncbi:HNH endonuclease signature motif containing protein [Crystallibacter degradans]|uniref:HNH endonuclease signature motif containing protein n=1 Tax=Crystallibacter degradans TaxID=2726743 RepID=UPI001473C134|nr:HNH endonuclease signature motif containing protein [Arthrobacter sp. SF27]NMR28526.1 DUF222 domain-containing protein [Arthrobacter sp. SF27]